MSMSEMMPNLPCSLQPQSFTRSPILIDDLELAVVSLIDLAVLVQNRPSPQACGGGGGGRPDTAQAGGKDPARVDEAMDVARRVAQEATA